MKQHPHQAPAIQMRNATRCVVRVVSYSTLVSIGLAQKAQFIRCGSGPTGIAVTTGETEFHCGAEYSMREKISELDVSSLIFFDSI